MVDESNQLVGVVEQDFIPSITLRDYVNEYQSDALTNGYFGHIGRIVGETAQNVRHLHNEGIIHRDIKHDNILVANGSDSGGFRTLAYLIDFGLAKVRNDSEFFRCYAPSQNLYNTLTYHLVQPNNGPRKNMGIGSYSYTAPELARGTCTGTPQSDYFSLGIVLWEAFMAQRAFPNDNYDPIRNFSDTDNQRLIDQINLSYHLDKKTKKVLGNAIENSVVNDPQERKQEVIIDACDELAEHHKLS